MHSKVLIIYFLYAISQMDGKDKSRNFDSAHYIIQHSYTKIVFVPVNI